MQYDAIIVGAGLAGLSAASTLAGAQHASIALVEKREIGSNNPTPMTFADVPDRFDLEHCVIGAYQRFTFHSPLGNRSSHSFDAPQLVALDYQPACRSLLARAEASGGVHVYLASAEQMQRQADGWRVGLHDGRELYAPLVIDASGRGLFSSRALGLPRPVMYSHCYGVRLKGCRIPEPQEAFFIAPSRSYGNGGGWLYPLQEGQASFGFAILSSSATFPGRRLKENLQRALEGFEPYARWLAGAEWERPEAGSIPIFPLRRLVYDGLLIAGDSAGQATIWSCMGSEAALNAGQMAGQAAAEAVSRRTFGVSVLNSYQSRWDQAYRRIYRNNALVAPVVWSMSQEAWNEQIQHVQKLTPEQMVARLRVNWPVPTLPQAVFVRAYDLAGRARRSLAGRLPAARERAA